MQTINVICQTERKSQPTMIEKWRGDRLVEQEAQQQCSSKYMDFWIVCNVSPVCDRFQNIY